ncbi:MAG: preprotein translocase subunit SecG [Candidatus Omnitrophota bacterium]|nr:preprotein translocase subunit SecG [Candidatus Omnitrophota bacterium]
MLYSFVIAIHVIASLVLIMVILMQAGRGSGLSEMFGANSTQTIFGTSASNFLMKATAVCAVLFIFTCMTLAVMSSNRSKSLMESPRALSTEPVKSPETPQTKGAPVTNEKEPVPAQPE